MYIINSIPTIIIYNNNKTPTYLFSKSNISCTKYLFIFKLSPPIAKSCVLITHLYLSFENFITRIKSMRIITL